MGVKFDFLSWDFGKELFKAADGVLLKNDYSLMRTLTLLLDKINIRDIALFNDQPKNAYLRELIIKSDIEGIKIDPKFNDSIIFPNKLQISDSLELSDWFNLNEITALDLNLSAGCQMEHFPPNFKVLPISCLLFLDSKLYTINAIKLFLTFLLENNPTTSIENHNNDQNYILVYETLKIHFEEIFFDGHYIEEILKKYQNKQSVINIDGIIECLLKKDLSLIPPNFRREIRQAEINVNNGILDCIYMICSKKRCQLSDIKCLINYMKTNTSVVPLCYDSISFGDRNFSKMYLDKFYQTTTLNHVAFVVSLSFIRCLEVGNKERNPAEVDKSWWSEDVEITKNPIMCLHDYIICKPEEWVNKNLKNCTFFAWAIFLRMLKQEDHSELKGDTPNILDIDEEDMLDNCIMEHTFTSLKCLFILNDNFFSPNETSYQIALNRLLESMIIHYPWKIKELKNDSDDSARLLANTDTENLVPYNDLPQYLEEMFLLVASLFSRRTANHDLPFNYWMSAPNLKLDRTSASVRTSKKDLNLYKFVTILCESNAAVYPSQYFPYMKMLASMANLSQKCAHQIFSTLQASSQHSSTISWDHILVTLQKYLNALNDGSVLAGQTMHTDISSQHNYSNDSHGLLAMSEFEIEGMILALKLMEGVVLNDPLARKYFMEWKLNVTDGTPFSLSAPSTFNPVIAIDHPLRMLVKLILPLSIPLHLKAQILKTLTAFSKPSSCYGSINWTNEQQLSSNGILIFNLMEASNLLITEKQLMEPTKPCAFYFKLVLEEIESTRIEEYPLTIAFLDFLSAIWFPGSVHQYPIPIHSPGLVNFLDNVPNRREGDRRHRSINSNSSCLNYERDMVTPYLVYVCESIFLPLFSRNYKLPMEMWMIASQCLKLFENVFETCDDLCRGEAYDTIFNRGPQSLTDARFLIMTPLSYLISHILNEGPFSQIMFYVLRQGVTIMDSIGSKVHHPSNLPLTTITDSPQKKFERIRSKDVMEHFIVNQCCGPILRIICILAQSWPRFHNLINRNSTTDGTSKFTRVPTTLYMTSTTVCDFLILPNLDLLLSYICNNDCRLLPPAVTQTSGDGGDDHYAAIDSLSFPQHALLSSLILSAINNSKIEGPKLAQHFLCSIARNKNETDAKKFILYGISQYLDSYSRNIIFEADNSHQRTYPLNPYFSPYKKFERQAFESSQASLGLVSFILPVAMLRLINGSGQNDSLSKFSLFLLDLDPSYPENTFLYHNENSRNSFKALYDTIQMSPWLSNNSAFESTLHTQRNATYAPLVYGLFYKLSTHPKLSDPFLTFLRTQEVTTTSDRLERSKNDGEGPGPGQDDRTVAHNHFTLHISSTDLRGSIVPLIGPTVEGLTTDDPRDRLNRLDWLSSLYVREALFFKYFAIELRRCLSNSLPSYLSRYVKVLFGPTGDSLHGTVGSCNFLKFFMLLFVGQPLDDKEILYEKSGDGGIEELLNLIVSNCSTMDDFGFTYLDMDCVEKLCRSYFLRTNELDNYHIHIDGIMKYVHKLNVSRHLIYGKKYFLQSWKNLAYLMMIILKKSLFFSHESNPDRLGRYQSIYVEICKVIFLKVTGPNFCKELALLFTDLILICTTYIEQCNGSQFNDALKVHVFWHEVTPFKILAGSSNLIAPKVFEEILSNLISLLKDTGTFSSPRCLMNIYASTIQCLDLSIRSDIQHTDADLDTQTLGNICESLDTATLIKLQNYSHKYLTICLELVMSNISPLLDVLAKNSSHRSGDILQMYSLTLQNCVSHFEFHTGHSWINALSKSGHLRDILLDICRVDDTRLRDSLNPQPEDINTLYIFATKMKYLETLAMTKYGANGLLEAGVIDKLCEMGVYSARYELCLFGVEPMINDSIRRYNLPDGQTRYLEYILIPTLRFLKTMLCTMGTKHIRTCLQVINFWQKHQDSLVCAVKITEEAFQRLNKPFIMSNQYEDTNSYLIQYLKEIELLSFILATCQSTIACSTSEELKTATIALRDIMNTKIDIDAFKHSSDNIMNTLLNRFLSPPKISTTSFRKNQTDTVTKILPTASEKSKQTMLDQIIFNVLRYYQTSLQYEWMTLSNHIPTFLTANGAKFLQHLPEVLDQILCLLVQKKRLMIHFNSLEKNASVTLIDQLIQELGIPEINELTQSRIVFCQREMINCLLYLQTRINKTKSLLECLVHIICIVLRKYYDDNSSISTHAHYENKVFEDDKSSKHRFLPITKNNYDTYKNRLEVDNGSNYAREFREAQKVVLKQEPNISKLKEILKSYTSDESRKGFIKNLVFLETLSFSLQKYASMLAL